MERSAGRDASALHAVEERLGAVAAGAVAGANAQGPEHTDLAQRAAAAPDLGLELEARVVAEGGRVPDLEVDRAALRGRGGGGGGRAGLAGDGLGLGEAPARSRGGQVPVDGAADEGVGVDGGNDGDGRKKGEGAPLTQGEGRMAVTPAPAATMARLVAAPTMREAQAAFTDRARRGLPPPAKSSARWRRTILVALDERRGAAGELFVAIGDGRLQGFDAEAGGSAVVSVLRHVSHGSGPNAAWKGEAGRGRRVTRPTLTWRAIHGDTRALPYRPMTPPEEPIRVAIVGGGCAALTTAFELTRPEHPDGTRSRCTKWDGGWAARARRAGGWPSGSKSTGCTCGWGSTRTRSG